MYLFTFPAFMQRVFLSFEVNLMVNNKFGGHGVGLMIWVIMFILINFARFDYNLFFYFYTPQYRWSDMNGIGHFVSPQFWFNAYWLFLGALLLTIGYLFFERGIAGGFRERWRVAKERSKGIPRILITVFFIGWVGAGAYCYYNVSYINTYYTAEEIKSRSAEYEKQLKKFEKLPQPKMTQAILFADIYPDERTIKMRSILTIKNKTDQPIDAIHIQQDNLVKYSLLYNNSPISYTSPLVNNHSLFSLFKHGKDTANYRIYKLPSVMQPGDTAVLELNSTIAYKGFVNSPFTRKILDNGNF